jgi:peptide/nickel transport system permease protein
MLRPLFRHGTGSPLRRAFKIAKDRPIAVFLLKRLAVLLATLLAASVLIFAVLDVLPGNVAEVMLGESATTESLAALNKKLGLDRPPLVRYGAWMSGLARGDMGISVAYDTPVTQLVNERAAVTVPLAVMAMLLTTGIALVLGLYAAAHHNRAGDLGVMVASQVGIAVPNFWFGILLSLVFAVQLRWFSAGGFPGWEDSTWEGFKALVLPAVALAAVQAAILARITRSAVLDVLREDFVRTARAKGLSRRQVLWRHVLRNAMVPVLTIMGLQFANLLTGTVVIERVFSLPGLGRLVFEAIANRDLIVVRNVVMLFAGAVILINFLVDVLYAAIDPRLRKASS